MYKQREIIVLRAESVDVLNTQRSRGVGESGVIAHQGSWKLLWSLGFRGRHVHLTSSFTVTVSIVSASAQIWI